MAFQAAQLQRLPHCFHRHQRLPHTKRQPLGSNLFSGFVLGFGDRLRFCADTLFPPTLGATSENIQADPKMGGGCEPSKRIPGCLRSCLVDQTWEPPARRNGHHQRSLEEKSPHQNSNTSKVIVIRGVVHVLALNTGRISGIYGLTQTPGESIWLRQMPEGRWCGLSRVTVDYELRALIHDSTKSSRGT